MQKLFSMLMVGGVIGGSTLPAFACGGGGGCSSMSGGAYAYGGGRAVAYGKAAGRAPMLAQATPQTSRPTATTVVASRTASSLAHTVVAKAKTTAKAPLRSPIYTCPMHPQVQWTKPTDCPLCGMKLQLKSAKADAAKRAPAASDEHAGMDMEGTSHEGMDDMQMCPGCMMNMGGMSGANGKQAAPAKASSGTMRMAGVGCGC